MSDEIEVDSSKLAAEQQQILEAFDAGLGPAILDPAEHKIPRSQRVPPVNVTAPPLDSIGLIVCQGSTTAYGTAFYCAPNAVVAAKHTFNVGTIKGAWLYIGFDAKKHSVAPAKVTAVQLHPNLDLAVLIIEAAPRTALHLGGTAQINQRVRVIGYGFPYSDGSMQMTIGDGPVKDRTSNLLSYAITTSNGDSGAPVLLGVGGGFTVVGIHTSGDTGLPSGANFGIPMTPAYVAEVQKLLALASAARH
ncbi:serine protease [Aquincola sp. J276]|uniref:trypsin-like serine peptidase n=1 Tax=Aquincola sp. J276 TaxID=2898432 RepID=UPI002150D823|nr:serine protease [Aquincola sp. J276]MCR5868227.1 serine protease [Aquincola sp. J276]